MNDKIFFTGGEPDVRTNDFMLKQDQNRGFIDRLLRQRGNCIINGCNPRFNEAETELEIAVGYVNYQSKVYSVDSGSYPVQGFSNWQFRFETQYDPEGDKTYIDGQNRRTRPIYKAIPENVDTITTMDVFTQNFAFKHGKYITVDTEFGADFEQNDGYPRLRYRRLMGGDIEIIGAAQSIGAAQNGIVFTLPEGYRPELQREYMPVFSESVSDPIQIAIINTDGTVIIGQSVTSAVFNGSFPIKGFL